MTELSTESVLQLAAQCPKCGKRESRRVFEWRVRLYRSQDPDRPCETIICGGCRHLYVVKVRAYLDAA